MTASDLLEIESNLNISLPIHYKEFQINNQTELQDTRFEGFIYTDPEILSNVNLKIKNSGFTERMFVIGMAPVGCFYFIKNDNKDTSVYFADFEDVDDNGSEILQESLKSPEHTNLETFKNWILELENMYE